jgi:2-dehydropantoate 2-reductase
MTRLRITVLGSGSVGLAIAATYAHAGADVTLLARGSTVNLLRQDGITVSGVSGNHQIDSHRLTVSDAASPSSDDINCDFLIVATKAYQVQEVLKALKAFISSGVAPRAVLLLQNGWGSADEARTILPDEVAIFSSIMMIGIERRSPTHVNVNVQASPIRVGTLFAAASENMKEAVELGQNGFLPITYEDNIEPAILNKFLFNTCLNAIGAVTRMTYGELVTNGHTRHLITHVADETIRVVQLERKLALAANGADYVENSLTPFILPKAAAHRSSMLQDVEAGRRTEIDYLNGAIVRMGKGQGIATPYNDAVSSLIRAREAGVTASAA